MEILNIHRPEYMMQYTYMIDSTLVIGYDQIIYDEIEFGDGYVWSYHYSIVILFPVQLLEQNWDMKKYTLYARSYLYL